MANRKVPAGKRGGTQSFGGLRSTDTELTGYEDGAVQSRRAPCSASMAGATPGKAPTRATAPADHSPRQPQVS